MAKRKGSLSTVAAFMSEAAREQVQRQDETPSALALDAIRPDPDQPRQLLPDGLRAALAQEVLTPPDAMRRWLLEARLEGAEPVVKHNLEALRQLADAIAQHGLINPITVRPHPTVAERHLIVTGERRYWAHVLLQVEGRRIRSGATTQAPDTIQATLMPAGSSVRAHQLIENIIREDINVVEKAHGLWALRYEMSGDAYRRHDGGDKGDLVAWKEVEAAVGLSRQYRARIVAVLELDPAAQAMVVQHNLAEATIRPIIEKLRPYPDLQRQALAQLIVWQSAEARGEGDGRRIVPSVRHLVDRLLARRPGTRSRTTRPPRPVAGEFSRKLRGTLRYVARLDPEHRAELAAQLRADPEQDAVVADLKALRDQLDTLLQELS